MIQPIRLVIPLLASSLLAVPVCRGAVVFSDTFSQAPGTVLNGTAADVGGTWNETSGTSLAISAENSLDTSGAARFLFNNFTGTLGAGQVLTLSFDTVIPAPALNGGWAGVSLFSGYVSGSSPGAERMFAGNPSAGFWGTDGSIGRHFGTDNALSNHITLTYVYDTGAWSFTSAGFASSGSGPANLALNALRIANGNGADINVDNLTVDISQASVFSFFAPTPAGGTYSASTTNALSVKTVDGVFPVNTNTIVMQVDGATVAPKIAKTNNITTISYVPASPLSAGTLHSVLVTLAESGGTMRTNAWSFTTAFASLPAVLPGPFSTSNAVDIVVFTTNDAWLGANYQGDSSKTLYVSFDMEFNSTNDLGGATWGGLDFYQDGGEKLLVGKNGDSLNWSTANSGASAGDIPVQTNDWHRFVVRLDYSPGGQATANIWLDPDLTQPEVSQPNSPLTLALDNTFNNIRLRCGFNDAVDTFSNVVAGASPFAKGGPVTFQGYTPGQNASSAAVASPVSVQAVFGTYGVGTDTVVLNLDGTNVTPSFVVNSSSITVNYQPPNPFAPGSPHTVTLSLMDSNGTPYSTSWSFTADQYPSLPLTQTGPLDAFTGSDVILYNSQNEWIDGHYGASSTNTLYTRFSMTFYSLNGETGGGGGYGGLEFYLGNSEHLLVGNNWVSTNWSIATPGDNGGTPSEDLPPVVPIVPGEWHTMLVKCVYSGTIDAVKVWLDPDFSKSEDNQPNPPVQLTMDNTFDNIHLRAGNGSAQAEYTNIVISATAEGVGLPAVVPPAILSLGRNGGNLQLSWTGTGTLLVAPALTGPWVTNAIQANPQTVSTTNSAQFFRLEQ
jgi:hypothetical protein